MKTFTKSFTQQEPIPEAAIEAAIAVMRTGRLHRYNTIEGESSEAQLLEEEFAKYMGVPYALACSSGGYALHVAMRAAGVQKGDLVLCNAFTLAPVPGAIHNSGGIPVLVDVDENYCIDLDDLALKAEQSEAKYFMLSHMRGHIADMDRVMAICEQFSLILIEDCAHTMGAYWDGKKSGTFGVAACFSTQTYKHLNSGEGGFLTSTDAQLMAKAIMYSGSYMLYASHSAAPEEEVFADIRFETPNYSGRMDNLRAAILRPQLANLDQQCQRWNARCEIMEQVLINSNVIQLTQRPEKEQYVASTIQFSLPSFSEDQILDVVAQCADRGVILKWFGADLPNGYTSRYDSWRYIENMPSLPVTEKRLASLLDMRIPLTFSEQDCQLIAEIISDVVEGVNG
ncbi:MAG: dTDP-4-amino-4,6-dideoxygalactose transaminase [Oceanospirillaceae bacterium]|jgi:dTDP-4-amino-4,6-dideoxygalactose transaminase